MRRQHSRYSTHKFNLRDELPSPIFFPSNSELFVSIFMNLILFLCHASQSKWRIIWYEPQTRVHGFIGQPNHQCLVCVCEQMCLGCDINSGFTVISLMHSVDVSIARPPSRPHTHTHTQWQTGRKRQSVNQCPANVDYLDQRWKLLLLLSDSCHWLVWSYVHTFALCHIRHTGQPDWHTVHLSIVHNVEMRFQQFAISSSATFRYSCRHGW